MDREEVLVYVKCVFVILFIACAVVGNISVLYAVRKYKKLKTVPNYFVLNLAVADLLFAVTGMPMIVVTTIAGKWILGHTMCQLIGLLNSLFCTASIWTLVLISVHRYFSVAKANTVKLIFTETRTRLILVAIWIYAFLIAMPPLVGWSQFTEGTNFCLVDGKKQLSYSVFLLMINYFFPFVFLSGLYAMIFFLLKKHKSIMNKGKTKAELEAISNLSSTDDNNVVDIKPFTLEKSLNNLIRLQQGVNGEVFQTNITNTIDALSLNEMNMKNNNSPVMTMVTSSPISTSDRQKMTFDRSDSNSSVNKFFPFSKRITVKKFRKDSSKKKRRSLAREVKVTKMLLIVICGFFMCWTPFLVASVLYAFNAAPRGFHLVTLGIMTACMNSVINPIIYALMNNNFRFAFKSMYASMNLYFRYLLHVLICKAK